LKKPIFFNYSSFNRDVIEALVHRHDQLPFSGLLIGRPAKLHNATEQLH